MVRAPGPWSARSRPGVASFLPLRVDELIGAALERVVDGQRLGVREWQILHHDHAGDAARRIDPEERVVDAAPAQAAGGALALYLIDRDEEAEPPLVAAVSDEGEIGATRQRALECGNRDRADVVLAHQRHRL